MKAIMHYHKKGIAGLKCQDTPGSNFPRIRFMVTRFVYGRHRNLRLQMYVYLFLNKLTLQDNPINLLYRYVVRVMTKSNMSFFSCNCDLLKFN